MGVHLDLWDVLVFLERLALVASKVLVEPRETRVTVVCVAHKVFEERRAWSVLAVLVVTRESKVFVDLLVRLVLVDCLEFKANRETLVQWVLVVLVELLERLARQALPARRVLRENKVSVVQP